MSIVNYKLKKMRAVGQSSGAYLFVSSQMSEPAAYVGDDRNSGSTGNDSSEIFSLLGDSLHSVTLGRSFTSSSSSSSSSSSFAAQNSAKQKQFISCRYDFMPTSIDYSSPFKLQINDDKSVEITRKNNSASNLASTVYCGNMKQAVKECVLLIDKKSGKIVLEKIQNSINVKKSRERSNTTANTQYMDPASPASQNLQRADANVPKSQSCQLFDKTSDNKPVNNLQSSTQQTSFGSINSSPTTFDTNFIDDSQNVECIDWQQKQDVVQTNLALDDLADDLQISEDSSS